MAVPANYATLIAEIDAIVDDFNLSIFQVFGGKPSNLVSLMQLIDLRYKLFEAGGGAGAMHNESQLSAPGSTSSRNMNGFNRAFITATVANINTNVVLRIEGSNDNSNWVNLNASDADTTITANGTYGFQYVGCPQHIRTTFVSESGGTSATVNVITRLSA